MPSASDRTGRRGRPFRSARSRGAARSRSNASRSDADARGVTQRAPAEASGRTGVIATAGHVDHGKSTLITALTGIDPDRLREERERGMTIDLGFAWLRLPDGRDLGIVDVPGHQDFIRNMLAGVGAVDAVLLVVALDEGVMPQTREHVAILDLLGVTSAVVALTKRDLVDQEWLELVQADVEDFLSSTSLSSAIPRSRPRRWSRSRR